MSHRPRHSDRPSLLKGGSLDDDRKSALDAFFAPKLPMPANHVGRPFGHRRGSITDTAAAIAAGHRRGSVVQLAGVMASKAIANASEAKEATARTEAEEHGAIRKTDTKAALSGPRTSAFVRSLMNRSAEQVTHTYGFLMDHDYQRLMHETGYTRMELYDLFIQYKALAALSTSDAGVDRDTFVTNTPALMMEDSSFVGRVFDLLDLDGNGTMDWEEYLTAVNILSHAAAPEAQKYVPPSSTADGKEGEGRRAGSASTQGQQSATVKPSAFQRDVQRMLDTLNEPSPTERPRTPPDVNPDEQSPTARFGASDGRPILHRQASLKRPTTKLQQRQQLAEFLFKVYDDSGDGRITQEELYAALLQCFFVDRRKAEARYEECMAARAKHREQQANDDTQALTAAERANWYVHDKFGRYIPFNDLDADTVACFRDVCARTFAALDDNGSGSISCAEAVDYISSHPEMEDVGAMFGRAMLSGPQSDVKHLITVERKEAERRAHVDPAELERRRQILFESLYRGEHPPREGTKGGKNSPGKSTRSPGSKSTASTVGFRPGAKGSAFTGLDAGRDSASESLNGTAEDGEGAPAKISAKLGISGVELHHASAGAAGSKPGSAATKSTAAKA